MLPFASTEEDHTQQQDEEDAEHRQQWENKNRFPKVVARRCWIFGVQRFHLLDGPPTLQLGGLEIGVGKGVVAFCFPVEVERSGQRLQCLNHGGIFLNRFIEDQL